MSTSLKRWVLVFSLIGIVLMVDQVSKQYIINNLELYESRQPIPALQEVFQITRTYNMGAAFGFLPQAGDVILVIALVVVVAMLYFYPRISDEAGITRFATGLVVGGALGNALDRIQHEHVIDFIHYRIPGVISNVSNIADHAIVLGVILIFIDSWRLERMRDKQAQEQTEQPVYSEEQ